jgi:chemotaxis response regulator CheB
MSDEMQIIIADDHPIVRGGLRQLIDSDPQLKVVAEANDGEEAIRKIEELRPGLRFWISICPNWTGLVSPAKSPDSSCR